MKPTLSRVSVAIALLGLVFGGINVYWAAVHPGEGPVGSINAAINYAIAALQLVPALGLLSLSSASRTEIQAWSRGKKGFWMLWFVLSIPILLIGGLVAAIHVLPV